MRLFNKVLSVLFTMTLICGVATGCGQRTQPQMGDEFEVNVNLDPQISATLTVSCDASNDEQNIIRELAKGFNKYYPNIDVKVDPMSGELVSTLMGYAGAGTMPDIFQTSSFTMLDLQETGIILSLEPYLKAEAQADEVTFTPDDFYQNFWILGQKNFNGSQLMIPRAADQVVCHYNAKIIRAASEYCKVDLEGTYIKNGWTWDDFLKVCEYVRDYYDNNGKQNNYLLDGFLDWEAVYNPILESFGVEYFDENKNCTLDCEGTRKALDLVKNLIDKRYHGAFSGSQANFAGGQGAFMFHSQDATTQIKNLAIANRIPYEDMDESYYNVVTFPIIDEENPKIGCGVSGYSISSDSKNRDIAWAFLKFMTTKEGQNCIADAGKNYPPIRKDMKDAKNPENHWGKGLECYNMEAFVWGGDHNAITPTSFVTVRPARSSDMTETIAVMIGNYVDIGYTKDKAIGKAVASLEYWLEY